MNRLLTRLHVWWTTTHADRGQATAEYALVVLGAASVAMLLVAWATKTDKVTRLLNSVIDRVLAHVS